MTNLYDQEPWARRGEAATAIAAAVSAALPVGTIVAWWGTAAPTGWLVCDGAAIPAAYGALIALVGANTPNLKGKVIVGYDAGQTEFDALGETGGSKTSTAPHTHGLNGHDHAGSTSNTDGSHGHTVNADSQLGNHRHNYIATGQGNIGLTPGASNYNLNLDTINSGPDDTPHSHTGTTNSTGTHGHTVNGDSGNTAASSAAATSGNLPPYMALTWLIKAS